MVAAEVLDTDIRVSVAMHDLAHYDFQVVVREVKKVKPIDWSGCAVRCIGIVDVDGIDAQHLQFAVREHDYENGPDLPGWTIITEF